MYFRSKQHLELTSIYTVYLFFLKSQQMTPAGTLLMWLGPSLRGDPSLGPVMPPSQPPLWSRSSWLLLDSLASGHCLALSRSLWAVPSVWPTPAASHPFPDFIACRRLGNSSQVRHDQHSSQLAIFLPNGSLPLAASRTCLQLNYFWMCPWQPELRACDTTWAEFLP